MYMYIYIYTPTEAVFEQNLDRSCALFTFCTKKLVSTMGPRCRDYEEASQYRPFAFPTLLTAEP